MDTKKLEKMGACVDAITWCNIQKNRSQAWQDCQRGDWMLWLLGHLSGKPESRRRKKLVLCACECARLTLPHVPDGEDRPRIAIETAEKYARGNCKLEEVKSAADAAAAGAAYAADVRVRCAAIVRKHYPNCPRF